MNKPNNMNRSINQTLADYVKESAAWQNSLTHHQTQTSIQQHQQQQQMIAPLVASSNHAQAAATTTSLPWAAAVKAAEHQHHLSMAASASAAAAAVANQSAFERTSTIGSWSSPETSSSARGGWNADGSMRSDGTPDDGTAIWGNPTVKKTGIDWAEKESLANPTPANSANNTEKRIQKSEPVISSLNGTEAWGAPPPASSSGAPGATPSSSLISKTSTNSQQLPKSLSSSASSSSENSGNIYGNTIKSNSTIISNEPLGWGESSSISSSLQQGNNESSSPPNNSIWNHLTNNGSQQQHKPSADWLSSSSSASSASIAPATSSRAIDELNKQLEGTSLFDALSSSSSPPSAASSLAKNLSSQSVGSGGVSNSINDLKQMSAKFINSNDLIDPLSRPPMSAAAMSPPSSTGNSGVSSNSIQQSQMNAAYPLGLSPSRDLLKQMVHQIQLAVQAGHLNAQILNQPMSTPTLQLVYTLLQQIKLLQQFQEVQQRTVSKSNDTNLSGTLEPQISRIQQNIALLQKAITQQQAALTKNEALADSNSKQQQAAAAAAAANNFSYANISKLSTNMKVPSNNISNIISNNGVDGFKRGNLADSMTGNSNSDLQRLTHQHHHHQQGTIDANETIDKTLSPLLQSSAGNILNNNKARSFASVSSANAQQQQEAQKTSGMMSAQTPPTSSAAAWLAFNSSDLVSSSFSSGGGWPASRISANVSQHDQQQQQQLNSDLLSEYVANSRGWRTASDNIAQTSSASLAPGANINLTRSQQDNTNDILGSKDSSPYYDSWGNSGNSESAYKRNDFGSTHDSSPVSSLSPPALGGLSLQSNPWLFAQTSSSMHVGGLNGGGGKFDNGDADKHMSSGGDSLNYMRSNNIQQRSSNSLYDNWGNVGSMQYNAEPAPIGSKQSNNPSNVGGGRMSTTSAIGTGNSRPAPPPGLMSNFSGSFLGGDAERGGGGSRSTNDMSSLDASKQHGKSNDGGQQLSSRDSSASLWSGTWFD